jgi:hypothetical protein
VQEARELITINAYAAHALHCDALTVAHIKWGLERDVDALQADLALVAEAGVVAIEAGRDPAIMIRHNLGPHGPVEVPGLGDPSFVVAEVWIDAFLSAMLIGDRDLIERLTGTLGGPPNGPDGESPSFRLLLARLLRNFSLGKLAGADILEMVEATDPDELQEEFIDEALGRASPDGELLNLICEMDATGFQTALLNAQYAHRNHYQLAQHSKDWRGLLALDHAALLAIAIEKGLEVDICSDYLPAPLISNHQP